LGNQVLGSQVTGNQLLAMSYQLSALNFKLSTFSYHLVGVGHVVHRESLFGVRISV